MSHSQNIQIVISPWEETFTHLLKSAKRRVYLASPFIKRQSAELVIRNLQPGVDVRYLNSFKLANFYRGASDLEALRIFANHNVKQKNVHNLHAKFFIFDNQAVITSGNLTPGGLRHNWEYGVVIRGEIVESIHDDYLKLFDDADNPHITDDILNKAHDIIAAVPKDKRPKIAVGDRQLFADMVSDENVVELFSGGVESIVANLTSWKKDVFECLAMMPNNIFSLEEVYAFSSRLQKLHPENKNIEPKIRQQLQYLRDIGLVEFVGKGLYKKLWI